MKVMRKAAMLPNLAALSLHGPVEDTDVKRRPSLAEREAMAEEARARKARQAKAERGPVVRIAKRGQRLREAERVRPPREEQEDPNPEDPSVPPQFAEPSLDLGGSREVPAEDVVEGASEEEQDEEALDEEALDEEALDEARPTFYIDEPSDEEDEYGYYRPPPEEPEPDPCGPDQSLYTQDEDYEPPSKIQGILKGANYEVSSFVDDRIGTAAAYARGNEIERVMPNYDVEFVYRTATNQRVTIAEARQLDKRPATRIGDWIAQFTAQQAYGAAFVGWVTRVTDRRSKIFKRGAYPQNFGYGCKPDGWPQMVYDRNYAASVADTVFFFQGFRSTRDGYYPVVHAATAYDLMNPYFDGMPFIRDEDILARPLDGSSTLTFKFPLNSINITDFEPGFSSNNFGVVRRLQVKFDFNAATLDPNQTWFVRLARRRTQG
jgi:hypothetical protein